MCLRQSASATTNNQQPTTNNQQPTTNNQQPTTNNQQPTTNNQQTQTNNKQQAAGDKQQTTNNKQHTTTLRSHCGSSFGPCVTIVFALLSIRDFMWVMRGPLSEPAKEDMPSVARATAAARRRQRRLRQFLRHKRLTVAMLLAERDHHTAPMGQRKARSGEEVRVARHGHVPEQPPPQPELFQLYKEEPGESRPPCLGEPRGQKGSSSAPWSSWPVVQIH